jgi:hypothetical protein
VKGEMRSVRRSVGRGEVRSEGRGEVRSEIRGEEQRERMKVRRGE